MPKQNKVDTIDTYNLNKYNENSESHLENADLCVLNPILGVQIFSLFEVLRLGFSAAN